MLTLLKENWELITGIIGSIVAFFGGRKSKRLNEKTTELENIEKVREIEKKLLADMEDQVNKLIKYNDYLEGVVKDVKKKLVKYVDKYGELDEND
ncbi:hypothetical protein [Tenacibaculum sp. C7A-26P2]|uniref:hypothetical protein n=1 Tax=Tenacibaculum sp. C7A-26P2 TaxID=3447504 RepID=UPI003F8442A2